MLQSKDGLYINRVRVADATGLAMTYQSNDLSKPDSLQTNYSNTFSIPDSIAVRMLTGNAEQLDSGSRYAYQAQPAYVIDNGEIVFSCVAKLVEFTSGSGWKVVLYEEKRDLFDRLDRSIRTADLSEYDHEWTIENINARIITTDGVCYPLIDYGLISANLVPNDNLFPAVFAHTVIRRMLTEEGYRLVGDLPADPMFKRLIIPFSEQEGVNHDEKWVNDRKARVAQDSPEFSVSRGPFGSGRIIDRNQPFTIDNQPDRGYQQGILKNYNTSRFEYVADSAYRLKINAVQGFKCRVTTGAVEATLQVVVNDQKIAESRWSGGSPHNVLYLNREQIELKETISVKKGDRVQIWFFAQRQTKIGDYAFTLYNDPDSSWAAFTPDTSLQTGDYWPVARNLPDVSGRDLMGAVARIFCGTWNVDNSRREVEFIGLTQTVENTANAVDWSNRLDTGSEPGWAPKLEPYAIANYLKWTEIDETKSPIKDGINYGDGVINVNASTLEPKTDLFTLPFAASTQSVNEVGEYGSPVLIETRTTSGSGSNVSISKQNTTPRLLLVGIDGESFPAKTKRLQKDGVTIEEIVVNLRPCWFGPRPNVAIKSDNASSLCFSPVSNMKGEQTLITRNYAGLIRVLDRMRVLSVSMVLRPSDISELDFGRPIRLRRVAVGSSLKLSDGMYYLNTVSNYRANQPCSVKLIAFN